ncbi:BREX-2 system adenine-specific DNA-methyltransferase PglX [Microbacterium sp.]|uniref:BREX-2 system adenine-specific DNA-methyltransferase PglX n=1 Tax=Microbacterium sp. TaxID=51671 RepID=UPI002D767959|nr:BREX-2 system adenine-specific DNA-methyltransferase PglX [Microbacterium sp.]HET6300222.1 BREX-2 system adenine-specific DNA-methyltransferase PglX [Microbacterium sp.]
MIDSVALLKDLKQVLRSLETDLRVRAEDEASEWGQRLRAEFDRATAKERTGLPWIEWRDGEVSQAAVAWIIASVFIRFAEDNGLLAGAELDGRRVPQPWIAGPGDGLERAVENEAAFYAASPTMTSRDWLQQAFRTLAALPAGRPLVDPDHSPVWHAPISAGASDALLAFFRRTTPGGDLVHDFRDPELDTRFLGDLYQDLSEYAKKTYALLQTPVFVEEFILDLTLEPAITEFGLSGFKLIDPTCGSGHFLLGAFDRLVNAWAAAAPNVELGERVQRALDSIHGVDLNPFAVAIARFRLTVAAIKAAGIRTLVAAPAFRYHLAIGDSLLGGQAVQLGFDFGDGEVFEYSVEDLQQHADILRPGQYHVVVGNPPYITVKDRVLNQRYRDLYSTCAGKYALSVPFMELFFKLARKPEGGGPAGFVGQITSNSFMKREFGKKLIEQFLSGADLNTRVDLTHIIDTSGAYIPGHGTPTVILTGRRRAPSSETLRAVLGVRGEPSQPADPSQGKVWCEVVAHIDRAHYDGEFVSVAEMPRAAFARFPWSLSGGGAGDLHAHLEQRSESRLGSVAYRVGVFGIQGADDAFMVPAAEARRRNEPDAFRPLVVGDLVRDWTIGEALPTFFPYDRFHNLRPLEVYPRQSRWMWRVRTELGNRATFTGGTYFSDGRPWYEWHQLPRDEGAAEHTITFAFVATHNHFVLDRGGKVFNRSAPVIKLPEGATEDEHFDLLGVLNSSTACFWLKQVSYPKGGDPMGQDGARLSQQPWSDRYEFTGTKLEAFPLPARLPRDLAIRIDEEAHRLEVSSPRQAINGGRAALSAARLQWDKSRRAMVALQEELDWQVYAAYGLVDASLAPSDPEIVPIEPNERPFEVRLARAVAKGREQSAWFDRHGRTPLTETPEKGSQAWRDLWQARYDAAESGFIRMLERPEYKRRWAGPSWEQLVAEAAVEALLDRLEAPELWRDGSGRPLVRSAAQVADDLRRDEAFRELMIIHLGTQDYDLTAEVGRLLAGEAVPGLAALRYKESGMEKFREWERTWELQRAEDRGERVEVPVPPKYKPADFVKPSYWSARGKLDVPKERFVSFPGARLPEDSTELYGWAGWDHAERAQAVARLANDLSRAGAPDEQVIPLVGVLLELEPWLKQWHDEIDARSGVSPAQAISGLITSLLARLGIGRDQVAAWRPPAPTRGRRSAS